MMRKLGLLPILFLMGTGVFAQRVFIDPGAVWPDSAGQHIQAHGGGIIRIDGVYYWYGEQRGTNLDTNYKYVSGYRSKDLMN
ncbi:hypothetical protein ACQ86N_21760 [Puia sp. P3]|uniref:hypothetical protein n=1 Tax=Puia sp. P3 TaxID=3423952 RepID=UPI003D67D50C